MTAAEQYAAALAAIAEHVANVGPISGSWACSCGKRSTNGSIRVGDLTTKAERAAEWTHHIAAAVLTTLGVSELATPLATEAGS